MTRLTVTAEAYPIAGAFRISRETRTEAQVVVATLTDGAHRGRGECVPYKRYGESVAEVVAEIEAMAHRVDEGLDREGLRGAMKAGAARNALDCALWDLEAKRTGVPVAERLGLSPAPLTTAFTLSLGEPEEMAQAAREAERPLLKVKLGGTSGDDARIRAVREAAPEATLIVDANEGWSDTNLLTNLSACADAGVALVEQPLPAGEDDALIGMDRPVPVCADESCHDRASLPALAGKYDMVNIKLDKTGGLTEALSLRDAARAGGYGIMVGCMVGSSLAMAPATLVAQGAAVTDLDGPLLLAEDRENALIFDAAGVHPPEAALWG